MPCKTCVYYAAPLNSKGVRNPPNDRAYHCDATIDIPAILAMVPSSVRDLSRMIRTSYMSPQEGVDCPLYSHYKDQINDVT